MPSKNIKRGRFEKYVLRDLENSRSENSQTFLKINANERQRSWDFDDRWNSSGSEEIFLPFSQKTISDSISSRNRDTLETCRDSRRQLSLGLRLDDHERLTRVARIPREFGSGTREKSVCIEFSRSVAISWQLSSGTYRLGTHAMPRTICHARFRSFEHLRVHVFADISKPAAVMFQKIERTRVGVSTGWSR